MLPLPLASLPATLAAEGPREAALLALPASRVTTVSAPFLRACSHYMVPHLVTEPVAVPSPCSAVPR